MYPVWPLIAVYALMTTGDFHSLPKMLNKRCWSRAQIGIWSSKCTSGLICIVKPTKQNTFHHGIKLSCKKTYIQKSPIKNSRGAADGVGSCFVGCNFDVCRTSFLTTFGVYFCDLNRNSFSRTSLLTKDRKLRRRRNPLWGWLSITSGTINLKNEKKMNN